MCSRYNLTSPPEAVRSYFRFANEVADFPPRFNIAPTQPVAIVRLDHKAERELALVRWGLIPPWVKDPRDFTTLINARCESAADKPSFRGALRHRRCLVPANGFYEWTGRPGAKRPHLIKPRTGSLMAMAGLWEHWLGSDGSEIETMAILTCGSNKLVSSLHDRMPVILTPDNFDRWLDCRSGTAEHVRDLLCPAPEDMLEVIEVSPRLNDSRLEGPNILQPVAPRLL